MERRSTKPSTKKGHPMGGIAHTHPFDLVVGFITPSGRRWTFLKVHHSLPWERLSFLFNRIDLHKHLCDFDRQGKWCVPMSLTSRQINGVN